jgi:hypothetical protein
MPATEIVEVDGSYAELSICTDTVFDGGVVGVGATVGVVGGVVGVAVCVGVGVAVAVGEDVVGVGVGPLAPPMHPDIPIVARTATALLRVTRKSVERAMTPILWMMLPDAR